MPKAAPAVRRGMPNLSFENPEKHKPEIPQPCPWRHGFVATAPNGHSPKWLHGQINGYAVQSMPINDGPAVGCGSESPIVTAGGAAGLAGPKTVAVLVSHASRLPLHGLLECVDYPRTAKSG